MLLSHLTDLLCGITLRFSVKVIATRLEGIS